MGHHDSESPIRAYSSPPRRKSPLQRARSPTRHGTSDSNKHSSRNRSPTRHGTSNSDKHSSRNRSPKFARSRSPEPRFSAREKTNHHKKSPKKSSPPVSRSPVRKKPSDQAISLENERSMPSLPTSPPKEKLPSRTRSLKHVQSRSPSPERRKSSIRVKTPRRVGSRSPNSHSLSPRSKRLKRVKAQRDAEKGNGRENERNHSRKGEEKDPGRDLGVERNHRKPERDAADNSSRSRHRRSHSPSSRHNRGERRSRSPAAADSRGHNELTSSRDPEQRDADSDSIAKMKAVEETLGAKEKQKPSFELSGKLAAETNRVRGVTLLFNEPPDARKPDIRWRLYVFKGGEVLNEPLYVHRQSCYLFGRERRVADIPTDHPSCSKQHAVLQYRQVDEEHQDGSMSKQVRPYLMDLGSTNGTSINDNKIEPQRYYQLFEKDTIKFGNSSREYVLLHENSSG